MFVGSVGDPCKLRTGDRSVISGQNKKGRGEYV